MWHITVGKYYYIWVAKLERFHLTFAGREWENEKESEIGRREREWKKEYTCSIIRWSNTSLMYTKILGFFMCMRIGKTRHKKKESNWLSELYLVKNHRNFLFIIATDLGRQTFLFILHTNTVKTTTNVQRRIFLCVSVSVYFAFIFSIRSHCCSYQLRDSYTCRSDRTDIIKYSQNTFR